MGNLRQRFETWISSAPFERSIERFPDDERLFAWPGNYRDIAVELAWQAWQVRAEHAQAEIDRITAEKAALALHFAEAVLLLGRIRNVLPFETEICARINRFLRVDAEQPLQ